MGVEDVVFGKNLVKVAESENKTPKSKLPTRIDTDAMKLKIDLPKERKGKVVESVMYSEDDLDQAKNQLIAVSTSNVISDDPKVAMVDADAEKAKLLAIRNQMAELLEQAQIAINNLRIAKVYDDRSNDISWVKDIRDSISGTYSSIDATMESLK